MTTGPYLPRRLVKIWIGFQQRITRPTIRGMLACGYCGDLGEEVGGKFGKGTQEIQLATVPTGTSQPPLSRAQVRHKLLWCNCSCAVAGRHSDDVTFEYSSPTSKRSKIKFQVLVQLRVRQFRTVEGQASS